MHLNLRVRVRACTHTCTSAAINVGDWGGCSLCTCTHTCTSAAINVGGWGGCSLCTSFTGSALGSVPRVLYVKVK